MRNYVTIVSGLPRSGTSMMMYMLETGGLPVLSDHIRKADIHNPNGYFEFEPVKRTRSDSSWLADAVGTAVKMVYMLLLDLPNSYEYRVIFMKRHMDEVIASQEAMLESRGVGTASLDQQQVALMFDKHLSYVNNWLSQNKNFKVLTVNYNDLLIQPSGVVKQIDDFLDGGLHTQAMISIIDHSLYRQRSRG